MNGNETLMDLFRDPETMQSLSFGEKMTGSLITMVLGMGITFAVLILIWIFIAIMGKAMNTADKAGKKEEAVTKATPEATEVAPAAQTSDDSLVAVIAAAIAAHEGTSPDNLLVRKITRLPGESTPWANAANEARMATRKMY